MRVPFDDTTRAILMVAGAVALLVILGITAIIQEDHRLKAKQAAKQQADALNVAVSHILTAPTVSEAPLVSPTFTRFGMVQEQCKKHPTTRIHIDGLIVDCASFNSWYNVIELRRRDSQESTTACTGCNTCAACARVETF